MSKLLTQCGSHRCSLEQLLTIPEPQQTKSYQPLNHYDFACNVQQVASDLLPGYRFDSQQYALSSGGQIMFGVLTYRNTDLADQEVKLAIGLRNSYDKSMSAGLAVGSSVLVYDNLMFAGDIVVMRKHTGTDMQEDLHDQIVMAIYKSQHLFTRLVEDVAQMKQVPIVRREKFEFLGSWAFLPGKISFPNPVLESLPGNLGTIPRGVSGRLAVEWLQRGNRSPQVQPAAGHHQAAQPAAPLYEAAVSKLTSTLKTKRPVMIDTSTMSHQEWLQLRRGSIDGSNVSSCLGLSKYKSPYMLWLDKTGRYYAYEPSQAAEFGTFMEPHIRQHFRKVTGLEVTDDPHMYFHKEYPMLSGNIDGLINPSNGQGQGVLEIKCTTSRRVPKLDTLDDVPISWRLQLFHYMGVLNIEFQKLLNNGI